MKANINFMALAGFITAAAFNPVANAGSLKADIPFEVVQGIIYVNVQTPGSDRPLRFIFDTGANLTTFEETTARRLGLGTWGEPGVSGLGNAPGHYVRGINATCGGISLPKTGVSTSLVNLSLANHRWVDGLLGADFLRGKIVEMDFRTRRLHIETRGESSVGEHLFGQIPFNDRSNVIWITVNSPDSKRPLKFLLDTGARKSVLSLKVAKSMGLELTTGPGTCVVGGSKRTWQTKNFKGTIDGRELGSRVVAMDLNFGTGTFSRRVDGIVGMDFMNSKSVGMNFGTKQVAFNDRPSALPTIGEISGIRIAASQ
ncbi:MAG: pepsin/retropepsin-like aspartic protease family protein [Verrucomicrobiota bacterium]